MARQAASEEIRQMKYAEFTKEIQKGMKEKGYTMVNVAKLSGLTVMAVREICTGSKRRFYPTKKTICRLCGVFGMDYHKYLEIPSRLSEV